MAGLSLNTQTTIAFKNLLNKSNTDVTKGVGNEAEDIKFNVHANTIFVSTISGTPATAITAGVAVFVQADLVLDGTSNGHAFFATWPVTAPAGTDPLTAAPYAYGSGLLTGITPGQRVKNAISTSYGNGYEAIPYSGIPILANRIFVNDPRNWIYQYQSGVFFQENLGTTPQVIEIYAYTGTFLNNALVPPSGDSLWELIGANISTSSNIASPAVPNVLPNVTAIQNLGSAAKRWNDLYLDGTIDFDTTLNISAGNSPVDLIASFDSTGLSFESTKVIKTSNGLSQIDLDHGGTQSKLVLSIDNGVLADAYIRVESTDIFLRTQSFAIDIDNTSERLLIMNGVNTFIPTVAALVASQQDEIASIEVGTSPFTGASFRARTYNFYDNGNPIGTSSAFINAPSGTALGLNATTLFLNAPSIDVSQQASVLGLGGQVFIISGSSNARYINFNLNDSGAGIPTFELHGDTIGTSGSEVVTFSVTHEAGNTNAGIVETAMRVIPNDNTTTAGDLIGISIDVTQGTNVSKNRYGLKIVDGGQGNGRVLKSDGAGNATWQPIVGTGSVAAKVVVTYSPTGGGTPDFVTHGLSTADVLVQVVDTVTGDMVFPKIGSYTTGTVGITFFGTAPATVKAIIIG